MDVNFLLIISEVTTYLLAHGEAGVQPQTRFTESFPLISLLSFSILTITLYAI